MRHINPSLTFNGNCEQAFNFYKSPASFIFHKGELIKDKTGLLVPAPKGKAYLKFHAMKEIKGNKANIQNIVKAWIKVMDGK